MPCLGHPRGHVVVLARKHFDRSFSSGPSECELGVSGSGCRRSQQLMIAMPSASQSRRHLRCLQSCADFCPLCSLVRFRSSAWTADKPADRTAAAKLNNLGVAYMNQQRMDKAVEEFDQALKADPGLTVAELNKGIALLNLQKLPEAEEALNAAAAKDPSNPRVWYNLGLLRRSEGKPAEAIEAFQRVLKIDPDDPDTHYFLGAMYSQQQQYDQSHRRVRSCPAPESAACIGSVWLGARFAALG